MGEQNGPQGLHQAVTEFVEKLYEGYRLGELLRSDLQSAKNAVEVAFEELKVALYLNHASLRSKKELKRLIRDQVSSEHQFLFDDIIEWDTELDGLIRPLGEGLEEQEREPGASVSGGSERSGLSPSDWGRIRDIGEGAPVRKPEGLSLHEAIHALEELSPPRAEIFPRKKTEGLSTEEAGAALEDLVPEQELTQPNKIWERLMGCRNLPPHDYRVKTRGILKAWKMMWDEQGRDDTEFQRFLYFMLRLSGEHVEDLKKRREDLNDAEVQRASHLNSALQIFSAQVAEDLARRGKMGKAAVSARSH